MENRRRPALGASVEPGADAVTSSVFSLPDHLAAKDDPTLIGDDERHFAEIARSLAQQIDDLSARLDAERRAPGGTGQAALDRDLEIHRLTARLRTLRRFRLDLCLGRIVADDATPPLYIGRLSLTDGAGRLLLVDWRAPAAEPFFAATHGDPRGLVSRRRYRWNGGRITDYWDEVFTADGFAQRAALDDRSAFIASLGSTRSPRMRDVLGTIQADQDAVIRADSRGALVVDGGPGTGKTVVALHRAAYLIYSDPRLARGHGGVLFVGPHQPYLAYVADVLPSLGEDSVQTCTLRDLVPEGRDAAPEADPRVAALKASAALRGLVEAAVRHYERPPTETLRIETAWADVSLTAADWADAFDAPDPGTPHDEARDEVWDHLLDTLVDQHDDDVPAGVVRRAVARDETLARAFTRAWPLLDPVGVVADLWAVPAYLRQCAPDLTEGEVRMLRRDPSEPWTESDLPFLDAARRRIGDPEANRAARRREAALAADREQMDRVVDDLIASHELDDGEGLMTMLRGDDVRTSLVDDASVPRLDPDLLRGPFSHIVVDEAQELTDAEWRMLLDRCPSRSFTIVGDRAQARHGFAESWEERLERVGLRHVRTATLTVNYRTPEEVMAEAEPVIRAVLPEANVPRAIRRSGLAVLRGRASDAREIVASWLAAHEGIACVIGDPAFPSTERVRSLPPQHAKGLEFDLVVLVEPDSFGSGVEGAVDRYVAMTRATRQLVILDGSRSRSST
ncbi:RNA polymerase recycling motor ATPase HelR [Microbacterium hatanonis]